MSLISFIVKTFPKKKKEEQVHASQSLKQTHPHAVRVDINAGRACAAQNASTDLLKTPSMPCCSTSAAFHVALCFSHALSQRLRFVSAWRCHVVELCQSTAGGKMSSGEDYFRLRWGKDSQLFIHSWNLWLCCKNMTLYTPYRHPKGFWWSFGDFTQTNLRKEMDRETCFYLKWAAASCSHQHQGAIHSNTFCAANLHNSQTN